VPAIQTAGLSKTYRGSGLRGPGVQALEDLTIEVREGEIFGFLGPNGAGKSTTIRLLLGYLHATAGRASLFGLDVERDGLEIRRRVGYLPGGIALYDNMSGQDLLDYLGHLYGRGSPRRAELLERLELGNAALHRPVRDYSRGMRQKMGIVQALQHDPELAILDEPSEGLDPLMQQAFYAIIEDYRNAGRTVFFSSHILPEVERICDRVAIIRQGRLVALEDVTALLSRRRRHVELRVEGTPPDLQAVPGVSDVHVTDGLMTCLLQGDVQPFLQALSGMVVKDLTIRPASLEDAFLEYYADDMDGRGRARPVPAEASEAQAEVSAPPPETSAAPPEPSAAPPEPSAAPEEASPPPAVVAGGSAREEPQP
jgi:ABC-2 type transport system ATP-binding protein